MLAYHSIDDAWDDPLCVAPDAFAAQLTLLAERGYRGVTFSEAARAAPRRRRRLAAITFDDAFSTIPAARSILDELGWPATVFVPTSPVETREPMRWLIGDRWTPGQDENLQALTWSELEELCAAGWEIGSHSRTHRLLSELPDEEALDELAGSRTEIEDRLGTCVAVSYPWGELDDRVIELARRAGYLTGSGLVGGRRREPMAVPRFAVGAGDEGLRYALKTSAFVWSARGSGAWSTVDYLRHGRDKPVRRAGPPNRTALVLDGDTGPGLSVTRSLGRAGWIVVVPRGSRAARSRFAAEEVELPDAVSAPDSFASALRGLAERPEIDVVVPTTDASLTGAWDALRTVSRPTIVGGNEQTVAIALDKAACLRAAEEHGFPVPAWVAPASAEEAREAVAALGLPCVVKPRRSFIRRGPELVQRRHLFVQHTDQLNALLAHLADGDELPILQQYVPGRALSVSAVIHQGDVVASIARETFTFYPVAGGTSVWKRTVAPNDVGVADAVRLLQAIGLDGVAEVEYQVDRGGVPRLMEIGARLHGWIPLAIAAGVDLPLLAARVAIGDDVEAVHAYRVGVEMRWPAGELLRLRAAAHGGVRLPPGTSRGDVLAGLWPLWRPGMRYDGIDLGDPRPWLTSPAALLRRGRP